MGFLKLIYKVVAIGGSIWAIGYQTVNFIFSISHSVFHLATIFICLWFLMKQFGFLLNIPGADEGKKKQPDSSRVILFRKLFLVFLVIIGIGALVYQLYHLKNHVFHNVGFDKVDLTELIPHSFTIIICIIFIIEKLLVIIKRIN